MKNFTNLSEEAPKIWSFAGVLIGMLIVSTHWILGLLAYIFLCAVITGHSSHWMLRVFTIASAFSLIGWIFTESIAGIVVPLVLGAVIVISGWRILPEKKPTRRRKEPTIK